MIKIKSEKILVKPEYFTPTKGFKILGTFNPGAMRLANGDIVLYVRVMEKLINTEDSKYVYSPRMAGENEFKIKIDKFKKKDVSKESDLDFVFKDGTKRLTYISHLRRVYLNSSGLIIKAIEDKPCFYGLKWDGELGIEDSRITKIKDLYVMTYVSLSREENISTSYAISNDCMNWYRRGIIFGEQDKDVVMFPETINKKYVAFNRPEGNFQFSLPHIWISYSENLEYWGDTKSMTFAKKGDWDYSRTGAGPPPIKTKFGWLFIYHVVAETKRMQKHFSKKTLGLTDEKGKKYIYSVGAVLLDLNDPSRIMAKAKLPIILPEKSYEKGTFEDKKVIFPTGMVLDKNKKDILIYSGAGDVFVTVKKVSLIGIINTMSKIN